MTLGDHLYDVFKPFFKGIPMPKSVCITLTFHINFFQINLYVVKTPTKTQPQLNKIWV